jgi:transporter family-2 protein
VAPQISSDAPVALALLPLAAGVAVATQQALNGRVAAAAGGTGTGGDEEHDSVVASVLPAATTNFVVGLVALVLAGIVAVLLVGPPHPLPGAWYLYLGGPFGAVFIGLGAWVVGQVGVLLLSLGAVAGQIVSALVLDLVLPSAAGTPGLSTVLGALLTLVAAGVASAPWPLHRRATRGTRPDLPE